MFRGTFSRATTERIYDMKRDLVALKRAVSPLVEVCNRFFAGRAESAEDLYDLFLPLIRHEQQPGIGLAIRKEIFRRRGLIASARLRAPGPSMDADDHAELGRLLGRLQRRLHEAGEASLITSYPVADATG